MAPSLVPVLLKPEWDRHLVMPANGQLLVAAHIPGIAAPSPALTLPECSLSVAGNIILQALFISASGQGV